MTTRVPDRRGLTVVAPYVLLPLVLIVLVPAFVLTQSDQELATFEPAGFVLLALTAAVVALLLLAIARIEARSTTKRFFAVLVEFVFFFVVITGFVLPASVSSTMVDPEVADADVEHIIVALVIAFAMLLVAGTTMRTSLYAAITAFIAVNAVLMTPALVSHVGRPATLAQAGSSIFSLSRDRNILVMSFDGLPGSAVHEVLERDPDLREQFAGFTLYSGVASSSASTIASTATSLYGNQDYKERYGTEDELWDSAPQRLITNVLDGNGWQVSTYGQYSRSFRDPSRAFMSLAPRPPASVFELLNYGLARSLSRVLVIGGELGLSVDNLYSDAMAVLTGRKYDASSRFVAAHLPVWKRGKLTPTVQDYEEYVKRLDVSTDEPVAHLLHFTHTHYPVEFDQDCRWAGEDPDWYMTHQDRAGIIEQTHCALTQMAEYLDRLKELGVFDRSLIVLKSDHGEPSFYYDPDSMESFRIRGHPYWGYGRYAPFLAIKGIGPATESLAIDSHPVLLDDLARTLCVNAAVDVDCDDYGGYDLLGEDWSGIEDDVVTVFVPTDDRSSSSYDTHTPLTIRRGSSILASMHEQLSGQLLQTPVSCSAGIDVATGAPLDNGRSDLSSWMTWHDGPSSFIRFRVNEACPSINVTIGGPDPDSEGDLAVSVNGHLLADAQGASIVTARVGSNGRSIDVPASMVAGSELVTVEVIPVDEADLTAVPIRATAFEPQVDGASVPLRPRTAGP